MTTPDRLGLLCSLVAGVGIPAVRLEQTADQQNFGNLPTGWAIIMVAAWVAFGYFYVRRGAVSIAMLLGVLLLVLVEVRFPTQPDSGPAGTVSLAVFLPIVAFAVAIGIALRTITRRARARHSAGGGEETPSSAPNT